MGNYRYTAYTAQQDGVTFDHSGTMLGAIAKARAYARMAYPSWGYRGYGPTIIVTTLDGCELHRERL
jgi:hypothetical protein